MPKDNIKVYVSNSPDTLCLRRSSTLMRFWLKFKTDDGSINVGLDGGSFAFDDFTFNPSDLRLAAPIKSFQLWRNLWTTPKLASLTHYSSHSSMLQNLIVFCFEVEHKHFTPNTSKMLDVYWNSKFYSLSKAFGMLQTQSSRNRLIEKRGNNRLESRLWCVFVYSHRSFRFGICSIDRQFKK